MKLRVLAEYPRVKLKNALFCLSILRGENFKKKMPDVHKNRCPCFQNHTFCGHTIIPYIPDIANYEAITSNQLE